MAKKTESQALVKEDQNKSLVVPDYSQYGGEMAGYEGQTNEDTSIPFIYLLQPGTPAVVKGEIDGAAPGMFMNNVTRQLWDKKNPLIGIPVYTIHEYIRWIPRKAGGGFVDRFSIDSPVVADAKKRSKEPFKYFIDTGLPPRFDSDQGDELQETFTVFLLTCGLDPDDVTGMTIMPFKSSAIRCYKNWMNQVRAHQVPAPNGKRQNPPLFSHLSMFTTELKNEDGNNWFVPQYRPAIDNKVADSCLPETDPRFLAAFAYYQFVKAGQANVNYNRMQNDDAAGNGEVDGIPVGPDGKKLF